MLSAAPLTPSQREVLEQLGATPDERPVFSDHLRDDLRGELDDAADALVPLLNDDEALFIGKRALSTVLGCPARYMADLAEPFEWSLPIARGVLAHKAIELSVFWPVEPTPLELVENALARLAEDESGIGRFVRGLDTTDTAELCSQANNRVSAFLECWPPLKRQWRPALESPVRAELAGGRIVLSGKVDLTLGKASGATAGKVIVDVKTGAFSPSHRDDLRFYALLDTLRIGVPPRRLATYYLDQGRFTPEDVTEALLRAAVARTVDAMTTIVALRAGQLDAARWPSAGCRFCPIRATCAEGSAYLRRRDDDDGQAGADDFDGM